MKSSRLFSAVAAVAILFTLAVSTAVAGSMGNGAAQRMKLVVESIDTTAGTIEFKSMVDNSEHTYKIDATTRISIVNKKGTIDQIKVGQKVENYALSGGQPPETLKMLIVSQAAPPPANAAPAAPAQ